MPSGITGQAADHAADGSTYEYEFQGHHYLLQVDTTRLAVRADAGFEALLETLASIRMTPEAVAPMPIADWWSIALPSGLQTDRGLTAMERFLGDRGFYAAAFLVSQDEGSVVLTPDLFLATGPDIDADALSSILGSVDPSAVIVAESLGGLPNHWLVRSSQSTGDAVRTVIDVLNHHPEVRMVESDALVIGLPRTTQLPAMQYSAADEWGYRAGSQSCSVRPVSAAEGAVAAAPCCWRRRSSSGTS